MTRPAIGIVHLGLGAFWRAFGVPWLEDIMSAAGGDWGVLGVSLRSPRVRDALAPADFVYHALQRTPEGASVRRIAALRGVLVAPEDPRAVVRAMADPAVTLVTLTITEKGYCHMPGGAPDLSHPGLGHDLANPELPQTAPGLIVAALARRRAMGVPPFTCLSCDNLSENGRLLRGIVLGLARRTDPGLADWIAARGAFPCAMVDRIVPAATMADLAEAGRLAGAPDDGAVVHEPFRQWVIEDAFCGPRPGFETAGVQIVGDVASFERMKLRCLNGTHSALAYVGLLAGKTTVADAVADPAMARFVERLWSAEIVPSFPAPDGVDVARYCNALMARYRNPGIRHRLDQIAMDGSLKLPQRLFAPMADLLAAGRSVDLSGLVVAAWIHCLRDTDTQIRDPLAAPLRAAAQGPAPVDDILAMRALVPAYLADDPRFATAVRHGYDTLARTPVLTVLERVS